MLKLRVATSDLSIIRGCKSLLCQPAVKGANMPWPLNLGESLCKSVIDSSLHGNPTRHMPNACKQNITQHNRATVADRRREHCVPIFFSCVTLGRWS
jgi:hypothetical protein